MSVCLCVYSKLSINPVLNFFIIDKSQFEVCIENQDKLLLIIDDNDDGGVRKKKEHNATTFWDAIQQLYVADNNGHINLHMIF